MVKISRFEIRLAEDYLILHGTPHDSAGSVLRGRVLLKLDQPCKFKSLTVRLRGKAKATWAESDGYHILVQHKKKELIDFTWTLLEPGPEPHVVPPGEHSYYFDYPFSGALPETVHTENGDIQYRLEAIAERPLFKRDLFTEIEAIVKRYSSPYATEQLDPVTVSGTWAENLGYELFIPMSAYGVGDMVPTLLKVWSTTNQDISIKQINFVLKEFTTYSDRENGISKTETKLIKLISNTDISTPDAGPVIEKHVLVPINENISVHHDCNTDLINVHHLLRISVEILQGESSTSYIIETPFVIMPASNHEIFEHLPPYAADCQPGNSLFPPPPSYANHSSNA
ncbi:hypothetical protein K493DRAFT_303517 [Basidiobolus meristosporus CBS 931.73]|uniref:Arrestin C-terminal-like domain-containing protein n=1 Tax=Basidiobolus meristosporus CBS 931.73 TaxID=1314790 RepID=A0A1Y1Y2M7_9FUNG|nr:hypothetical protein K493DRAFT_303517 [Basidiobolus meristosporus CBS 931.73]|eukprot:ORX92229.1 hypothetical protein K493DRAFT_303517 [Basidiobolus meristosporus CBS 931.73]